MMRGNTKCPHADIIHCPLAEAAHIAGAGGCDDGQLDQGGCAVDRGQSYDEMVGRLTARHPRIVAQCRWNEQLAERRDQRTRNMRLNGVH